MSDAFDKLSGGGYLVDYTVLKIGAPAGDRFIVACAKCGKPGVPRGRRALHIVRYHQSPSGKDKLDVVRACPGGAPRVESTKRVQTGFAWCPKEWL